MITAIIPVFNSSKTLHRAIDSLLIQPEVSEIIIVDDGSTDDSWKVATSIVFKDSAVKLIFHKNNINLGASASRNIALKIAKNNWIQFLDADDELIIGKISSQLSYICENTLFIVGKYNYISNKSTRKVTYLNDVWSGLLIGKLGITSANLWNKDAILEVGGWDENLVNTQEYDLMFRLAMLPKLVKFSKGFFTNIYKTENSISFGKDFVYEKRENLIKLRIRIKTYLQKNIGFSLVYNYYFSAYVGTVLRYHKSGNTVYFSKLLFYIFKSKKSISDRLLWLQ